MYVWIMKIFVQLKRYGLCFVFIIFYKMHTMLEKSVRCALLHVHITFAELSMNNSIETETETLPSIWR